MRLMNKCIAYAEAIRIRNVPSRPRGTCSRRNGRSWSLIVVASMIPCAASLGVEDLPGARQKQYSVNVSAVGRPVEIHAYADRIVIARMAASSRKTAAATVEARPLSPVALRAGPGPQAGRAAQRRAVQGLGAAGGAGAGAAKLAGSDDGDRQMVAILATVRPMDRRRLRLPARRRCPRASIIRCDHQHPHAAPRSRVRRRASSRRTR